jgi:hypothetical protein
MACLPPPSSCFRTTLGAFAAEFKVRRILLEASKRTEEEKLRDLAAFTCAEVRDVMVASMITMAAEYLFISDTDHKHFARHPANVLPYQALRALEERSIVHIAEALTEPIFHVQVQIRRTAELRNHRDSISHPHTIRWNRPAMRDFTADEHQWLDLRAALVWDMHRSLNDELRRKGLDLYLEHVEITPHMTAMFGQILELSMKPHVRKLMDPELLLSLQRFQPQHLKFLEDHADGITHDDEPA